jgi:predicted RNase H-like nuclease
MTAVLADRFVAQLAPNAIEVLAVLCRNAPELIYEALQAQVQARLGISRDRLGGVLISLAAGRKRLPRDVDYSIELDKDLRRYRIEPVAAELLLDAIARALVSRSPAAKDPESPDPRLSTGDG